MTKVTFTVGDTDFILTNTSMEWFGLQTGVSHLLLPEISDERVEAIVRFMKLAAERAVAAQEEPRTLYEAKCAESEDLRNKARRAWFAYCDQNEMPKEFREAMMELYMTATSAEAGKPLLEKLNRLRQELYELEGKIEEKEEREGQEGMSEPRTVTNVLPCLTQEERRTT